MFPSMTDSRQNKRSLRALVRGAMDTALEFVTLGEATAPAASHAGARPHRRTPAPPAARSSSPPAPPRDGRASAAGLHHAGSSPGAQHLNHRARRRSALGGLIDPAGPRKNGFTELSSRGGIARLECCRRARRADPASTASSRGGADATRAPPPWRRAARTPARGRDLHARGAARHGAGARRRARPPARPAASVARAATPRARHARGAARSPRARLRATPRGGGARSTRLVELHDLWPLRRRHSIVTIRRAAAVGRRRRRTLYGRRRRQRVGQRLGVACRCAARRWRRSAAGTRA